MKCKKCTKLREKIKGKNVELSKLRKVALKLKTKLEKYEA